MAGNNEHPDESLVCDTIRACTDWRENGNGFGATSSVLGSGAVEECEKLFSALHANRPSLLTASATYGIRSALKAAGVVEGDIVLMPEYDWPASFAAVLSLGAIPKLVAVDPETLTLDPKAIRKVVFKKAKAICATHIYGVPADIPAIRAEVGGSVAIIEDCAQALGSSLDGRKTGTLDSDYAVFSFGPGKQVDCGEGGMILAKDWEGFERILNETQHPVRQINNGGGDNVNYCGLSIRPHPLTAILLLYKMERYDISGRQTEFRQLAKRLSEEGVYHLKGIDERRQNAQRRIPVRLDARHKNLSNKYTYIQSGAFDLNTMRQPEDSILLISEAS